VCFKVAGRVVVVDDGVKRHGFAERVSPSAGLAVNHYHCVVGTPLHLFDGGQVEVEYVHHRLILRAADEPIARDEGRFAESSFYEVGEAQHAAEAVGVRLHVGDEYDTLKGGETQQEPIRPA
jgi:hypothetical protein